MKHLSDATEEAVRKRNLHAQSISTRISPFDNDSTLKNSSFSKSNRAGPTKTKLSGG